VYLFEEEEHEEGISVASDIVEVEGENPATPGSLRPLPRNISRKSENRVSKSKIEFQAPAFI